MNVKVSIIGAGCVGATVGFVLTDRGLCNEIVLVDIDAERAYGEALDMLHASSAMNHEVDVKGTSDYSDTRDSDVIVLTAGFARKPGDSRLNLAKKNASIVKSAVEEIRKYNKDCILLVVSNPVDSMTYIAQKVSGYPKGHVFGLGTFLDTVRFKSLIADELGISFSSLNVYVLGEHGDSMFPAYSMISVAGIPIENAGGSRERLEKIFEKVRVGGAQVIERKGGTEYAPAAAIAEVLEAVINNRGKIMPLSVLDEENDVSISLPVKVSSCGAAPMKIDLDEDECAKFTESVRIIRKSIEEMQDD